MSAAGGKDARSGMSLHGGARRGSGRPRKWLLKDVLKIGQACQEMWEKASQQAVKTRIAAKRKHEINSLYDSAKKIRVPERKAWLESEAFEEYRGDLEGWFHKEAGTPFNYETGEYERDAPRHIFVSNKPFRGTRKRIIAENAVRFDLSESEVDNLWQSYRRFLQEVNKPQVSAKT